jgi:hypothetical protein
VNYTGLGVYQQQPPKPPSRAPLWIALGVVAVLVVGAGITAIVVLRSGDDQTASPTSTSTASSAAEPDWQPVDDEKSGLSYELPPSWESSGAGSSGQVKMSTTYVSRPFQCQGRSMIQAQAMAGSIADDDPEQVATELVNRIAAGGYTVNGSPPEVGEPRVESGDGAVVRLSVEVTPKAANACYAPKATVSAVAMRNGSEVSVFVLNVAEGGPHAAEGPSDDDVERILESVRKS